MHPKHAGCANATMELPAIVQQSHSVGVVAIGITDHLNRPEQIPLHRQIRDELLTMQSPVDVFFGVELNFTGCDQGFVFSEEIKQEYQFQFAIGGIHSTYLNEFDLDKIIEIQHRHHLKTCEDSLVDVLVHPYWFSRKEFKDKNWPFIESMKPVRESLTRELAQAAKETGTAIEINVGANIRRQKDYVEEYVDYLSIFAQEGTMFTIGSDAHSIDHLLDIKLAWDVVDRLGIPEERIWRPATEPLLKACEVAKS